MSIAIFLKYYIKSELRSRYLWGWSIGFMVFWLVLGALTISDTTMAAPTIIKKAYVAGWYATVTIVGLGSAAVGLSYEFIYSSISARYLTKYSSLTPQKLYGGLLTGFIIVCSVISALLLLVTDAIFSWKLGLNATPSNIAGVFIATIATGIMLYSFSATAIFLSITLRKAKATYFAAYLPLMLALGLGLLQVNINLGWLIVGFPFNAAQSLLFSYYMGLPPHLSALARPSGPIVPFHYLWLSLLAWTAILSISAIAFLRLQKGVGVEEIRMI